jgi:uncharacterized membrane protein YcaP (DUF421 family)
MDPVIRAVGMYVFLFVVLRISGKRSFASLTPFDFVFLLVIGEATQQAMVGSDVSFTNAMIVILTLIGMQTLLTYVNSRSIRLERWLQDVPLIVLEDGKPFDDRLRKSRIDAEDILERARTIHGLERLDQIKYAVLERDGQISVIPKRPEPAPALATPG